MATPVVRADAQDDLVMEFECEEDGSCGESGENDSVSGSSDSPDSGSSSDTDSDASDADAGEHYLFFFFFFFRPNSSSKSPFHLILIFHCLQTIF